MQLKRHGSIPRGTPRNFRQNRGRVRKTSGFRRTKTVISLKRGKIGPRLPLRSNRKSFLVFNWCQNQRPYHLGWLWRVIMHSVSRHVRFSELTVKIWIKIDLYCRRQRCSPTTVVSGSIRFVPIFKGVPWRGGVKPQWGNRKHGLARLSTLRLRQLWITGQSCYTVIFSLLSPVQWPQNTLPYDDERLEYEHLYSPWMVHKKQNKSYNVQLNYNLTKRTQHTQISAMTAYSLRLLVLLFVTTLSDVTSLEIEFRI